ncbi:MAG TPA: efflux RND transporter periplasmic adaptor subunit [Thiothrix sp.]|nr:efflux RND transporter periplasmic adaptor subunit [Thiothrix sp.]
MITLKKMLLGFSSVLLMGGLFFSASSLLAEKHDHQGHAEHGDEDKTAGKGKHDGHDHGEEKPKEKGKDKHDEKDDGHGHGGGGHGGHDEEAPSDVELTPAQIKQAGIKTMRVKKQRMSDQISALSEVKLNQYKTIKVSPTITTRVEKRHVRLGDKVEKGQLLVTLHTIATTDISANMLATAGLAASSAEFAASIAEAKGELAAANATWERIRSLGRDAVSGKRYTEARIAKEQAEAKVRAYGKSQAQVKGLLTSGSKAVQKHFELRAEQAGTIISDDFVLGQVVNPEDVLIEISDLDHLWIEANIKPQDARKITKGSRVSLPIDKRTLRGEVINIGRVINEKTRTLPVRIEINSAGSTLYPGQFVKTFISSKKTRSVMSIPAEAVLRGSDGDWVLFVEVAAGRFEPKEVEIVENVGDRVIISGLKSGTTIVSKGTFALQSELAKGGFEIHNH